MIHTNTYITDESEVTQSCPTLATPLIVAHQALLSMRFSRQEYWSGLPFPSPGDLPNPGIKPGSPALQADSLPPEPLGKPFPPYSPANRTVPTSGYEGLLRCWVRLV